MGLGILFTWWLAVIVTDVAVCRNRYGNKRQWRRKCPGAGARGRGGPGPRGGPGARGPGPGPGARGPGPRTRGSVAILAQAIVAQNILHQAFPFCVRLAASHTG